MQLTLGAWRQGPQHPVLGAWGGGHALQPGAPGKAGFRFHGVLPAVPMELR